MIIINPCTKIAYNAGNKKNLFPLHIPYIRCIILRVLTLFLSGIIFIPYQNSYAACQNNIDQYIGIALTNDKGHLLYEKNINKKLIPASTLKLLTSLEAIHFLGENFRFRTNFFLDERHNLKVKGFGDPFLNSEAIKIMCTKLTEILKQKEIEKLNSIIIDNSFFSSSIGIPGTGNSCNPYDAPVGALCANFNTVFFKYDKSKNKFISAEPQTPLLAFTKKRIRASGLQRGRIILSMDEANVYAGLLMGYFIKTCGVDIVHNNTGRISNYTAENRCIVQLGHINPQDKKILTWLSPYTIKEIVRKLLRYSNNFIANQLFLYVGAKNYSPPATVEKAIDVLKKYAENTLKIKKIKLYEGSGLSHRNRIAPKGMIKILFSFMPYYELMRHDIIEIETEYNLNDTDITTLKQPQKIKGYEKHWKSHLDKSLSECFINGKKKKTVEVKSGMKIKKKKIREIQTEKKQTCIDEFYKTGTLVNVRTRAGYFKINNRLYPYVIMVNKKNCTYKSIRSIRKKLAGIALNNAQSNLKHP